jgi:TRAP transporter TAXI family solute receptor
MKKALAVLVVCAAVIAFVTVASAGEVKLILATGGTAGTYYPFGGAMAKIWGSKIPGMNVTAQATGASIENIRLMNKDEVELALVQSDNIDWAFYGKEVFKEKITKMAAIAVLYPEVVHIVVRGDSPAKTFGDLKGMKVGVGAPGSGTEANFRQLMEVYEMKKDDVKGQYLSYAESAEQFKDKHIDSFFLTTGVPNSAIMDVANVRPIKLVSIEDAMVAKITQKYPFLAPAKIPANTYKGQPEEVKTIAVMAVLIADPKLSESVVYNLTKTMIDNQSELASAHAKGKELSLQTATKGVSIPFHPGAVKYYKEKGVMK